MWFWIIAALLLNAAAWLRKAVLFIQDGTDRVKAGAPCPKGCHALATTRNTYCWGDGEGTGVLYVVIRTVGSPLLTLHLLVKLALFPRGIKSDFAKEQERQRKAQEAAARQGELEAEVRRLTELVVSWDPGSFIEPKAIEAHPIDAATMAWQRAADDFDQAAMLISATKGTAWVKPPYDPKKVAA